MKIIQIKIYCRVLYDHYYLYTNIGIYTYVFSFNSILQIEITFLFCAWITMKYKNFMYLIITNYKKEERIFLFSSLIYFSCTYLYEKGFLRLPSVNSFFDFRFPAVNNIVSFIYIPEDYIQYRTKINCILLYICICRYISYSYYYIGTYF